MAEPCRPRIVAHPVQRGSSEVAIGAELAARAHPVGRTAAALSAMLHTFAAAVGRRCSLESNSSSTESFKRDPTYDNIAGSYHTKYLSIFMCDLMK